MENIFVSPEVIEATEKEFLKDPIAKKISDIYQEIQNKEDSIIKLKAELEIIKKNRPPVNIKWRESIKWCLEVDSLNPFFFLKSVSGVYKCIMFKHKIDTTTDFKNKISTTLSMLYKEKAIGRISIDNILYYGLKDFFNEDLITIKQEYVSQLEMLRS